jgi:hypothetical protein
MRVLPPRQGQLWNPRFRVIMFAAGEPGDRRFAPRKRDEREESPDSSRGELERAGHGRATRLVTPGGCRERLSKLPLAASGDLATATESATENKPPVMLAPRRQACGKTTSPPVSVERIWQG